jgi:sulfoxide reductase heme-binding subunit YedZ
MTQRDFVRRVAKPALFAACLVPFVFIVADLVLGRLGANPVEEMTHRTGDWTLMLLLATLSVTPIRRLTGFGVIVQLRRMIGLFAFFYAICHFSIFLVFDHFFSLSGIVEDVIKRPFITVGFTSLMLLLPLAITSTKRWIRRLGGKRWNGLHRLVYVAAAGGVLHYLWLVKADVRRPAAFALVLVALLTSRLVKRPPQPSSTTPHPTAGTR